MGVSRTLKAKIDFSDEPHSEFWKYANVVCTNMSRSALFPKPPVPYPVFRAKVDQYGDRISAAMDRGRQAILDRNSTREEVAKIVTQESYYVDAVADGDPAVFAEAGVQTIDTHRKPPEPLATPGFKKIAHAANSGSVNLTLTPSRRKVKSYRVRLREADIPQSPWREENFTSANGPVTVSGLKPGTRYEFQVQALGILGWTDFCDSVFFICT
jgi:hypothetical protein